MDQNLNPGQESVSIELKNVSKHYGETLVLTPLFAHDGSRLPYRAAGTFRLRQNNAAAHDCGPGNSR